MIKLFIDINSGEFDNKQKEILHKILSLINESNSHIIFENLYFQKKQVECLVNSDEKNNIEINLFIQHSFRNVINPFSILDLETTNKANRLQTTLILTIIHYIFIQKENFTALLLNSINFSGDRVNICNELLKKEEPESIINDLNKSLQKEAENHLKLRDTFLRPLKLNNNSVTNICTYSTKKTKKTTIELIECKNFSLTSVTPEFKKNDNVQIQEITLEVLSINKIFSKKIKIKKIKYHDKFGIEREMNSKEKINTVNVMKLPIGKLNNHFFYERNKSHWRLYGLDIDFYLFGFLELSNMKENPSFNPFLPDFMKTLVFKKLSNIKLETLKTNKELINKSFKIKDNNMSESKLAVLAYYLRKENNELSGVSSSFSGFAYLNIYSKALQEIFQDFDYLDDDCFELIKFHHEKFKDLNKIEAQYISLKESLKNINKIKFSKPKESRIGELLEHFS